MPMLGKGVGIGGAGGAGTLHTSGNAKTCPPPLVLRGNISRQAYNETGPTGLADHAGRWIIEPRRVSIVRSQPAFQPLSFAVLSFLVFGCDTAPVGDTDGGGMDAGTG